MKNLKELYVNYKELYEFESHWEYQPNPEKAPKYNYFKFVWELFTAWVQIKRCKYFGHKWEYECDITPDSGSESMECTCCGEYHNITHY